MVKNDIYTEYINKEFIIYKNKYGQYKLLSNDKSDMLNLGFVKEFEDEDNIFTKEINKSEIGEVYSISTYCVYKGYKCRVERDNETQYEISVNNTPIGKELGFEMRDRDFYAAWVDKSAVEHVYEIKTPLPDFLNR